MSEIVITDSKLVDRKLSSCISVPKVLSRYIRSSSMFALYDVDIAADKSILNIPITALVLPLAWLTGSDVYVDELDKTFMESMNELKQEFEKRFPKIPFTTRINVDTLIENEIKADTSGRNALFFSGGVDSTYSLITNLDLKPRLIMIWGVEGYPYPRYSEYWENVIKTYSRFAGNLQLSLNIIKTNLLEILHERRIEHDFHIMLKDCTLWASLLHSLALIPLSAPLSIGRFDNVLFSASHTPEYDHKYQWVSTPSTDEKIIWADVKVIHEGYIHRHDKIKGEIKGYLRNNKILLRCCNKPKDSGIKLNCSNCWMCYDAIMPLAQAGIDPKLCGFEIDNSTFRKIKDYIKKEKFPERTISYHLLPLQKNIPNKIKYDLNNSKEFFKWYKNYNLEDSIKDVWLYRDIYNWLPYTLAKILDKIYNIIGINIHEHSPIRPPRA